MASWPTDGTPNWGPPLRSYIDDEIETRVPVTRTIAGKSLSADVTLAKGDVGLANVNNTADVDKPLSTATRDAVAVANPLPAHGAGSRRFNPDRSAYNVKPSNTRRWRAALAKAGRQDYAAAPQVANELWIGDSVVGGCTGLTAGAGGTARFDRLNTVADFAARAASAGVGGVVPGTGLVRWKDNTRSDDRVVYSFTPGAVTSLPLTTGQWAEFTTNKAGTSVTIVFYDNFAAGVTGFNVSVDGASSGAGFLAVTGTNTNRWRYVTLTVPVAVGGKVRVTGVTGTTQHGFVEVRDTTKGGVQQHNIAASGSKVVGDWEAINTGFTKVRQVKDAGALPWTPDVVHLAFPYFDVNDNPGNAAPFKASMQTLIGHFSSYTDVVLHALPLPGRYRGAGGDPVASYMPYLTALYELADTNNLPLLDLHELTGGYLSLQPLGLAGDDAAHWMPGVYAMWGRGSAALASPGPVAAV